MEENTTQLSAVPANLMPVQPGLKPVLPPVAQRYTEDQLKDKIEKHFGIVTSICNELDCTFSQFYRAVKHYKLESWLQESKKNLISMAEAKVLEALDNPRESLDAAKFILTHLGKNDGWSHDPNVAVAVQVSPGDKEAQIKAIFGIS